MPRWTDHAPFGLVRTDQAPVAPPGGPEAPSPFMSQSPLRGLQTLRDGMASRLTARRQDPTFSLRGHTLEELCEVLVMLTCGQEIMLLVDRDPWRWEHTAEELRVAEEVFGVELEALKALTGALSEAIGAEQAAEQLLAVFVEGAPGEETPSCPSSARPKALCRPYRGTEDAWPSLGGLEWW